MKRSPCRDQAVRISHAGSVVLAALFVVVVAGGAHRGRLFGPTRGDTHNRESEQTYYQPRELQRQRPTEHALPAAEPKPASEVAKASPTDAERPLPPSGLDKKPLAPSAVGDTLAAGKVALMVEEIAGAIRARQLNLEFSRWEAYMVGRVDASAGKTSGSELMGNCRLKCYDRFMRNPTAAPVEAERFTRELHRAVVGGDDGLADLFRVARERLDLPARALPPRPKMQSHVQALEVLQEVLASANADYSSALTPLTKSEIQELADRSASVFLGRNDVGHTIDDRVSGRRLCDLMERMDRGAMLASAEDLVPLMTEDFRQQLAGIPEEGDVNVPGVSGRVLKKITTQSGTLLIGGRGKNVYRLDDVPDVAAVIDLGGDDEYIEGTVSNQRPLLVIIDLKGSDTYRGTQPGIQGGAILGVSLLLDWDGNDTYEARDMAQASAIAGIGILVDHAGNDTYKAFRRAQGQALGGLGILVDRDGDDCYRAAMWGQGFGGPLGFGLLDDLAGKDDYFLGGVYPDSYKETPGLEGWGQGVGAGIRQVANGGIGVMLDGSGDDTYEFDYLSHGGGYWFGLGFCRDFAGNDKHLGSTEQSYDGTTRTQPQYQRFGNGWGCHYALGFLFDDAGDDLYRGWIMGIGFGWDCSLGILADFAGNDRYEANGSSLQGNGAQGSTGVLFDYDGNDVYTGNSQGYAAPSVSYHPLPACGGNFSFLIDYGGSDEYGCEASNAAITQRGWAGGYLIDRPRSDETTENADAKPQPTASTTESDAVSGSDKSS